MYISDFAFSVYPNPVKDKLFVNIGHEARVTIIYLSGTVLKVKDIYKADVISLHTLKKGIYIVRVDAENIARFYTIIKE